MKKKKQFPLLILLILMTLVAIILVILLNEQVNITGFVTKDLKEIHPLDRIDDSNIKVYSNKIVIEGNFGKIGATGTSMLQVSPDGTTHITIKPTDPEEIIIGEIIIFKKPQAMVDNGFTSNLSTTILHRVIDKGTDSEGIYYYTAGDSNKKVDGAKIRFENITKIVVGVIW